jgi:3-deoxy-alpha-D-manno-octulosonate 8-oxidase
MYKHTKNVPYYTFGPGAFAQLSDLIAPRRVPEGPVVFYVDHCFEGREQMERLPLQPGDHVIFVDTGHEPSVEDIDAYTDALKRALHGRTPVCLVGMGGGSTMDVAKAVGNMLVNPGKAEDYQGWDLVKNAPPYKIGVPTLSGTGAEASRTCVLTNTKKRLKMGMNSDLTMYDHLVLDPELTARVPRDQYLFSGLDTFMHCVESLRGSYRNVIVDALAKTAVFLCKEVFLGPVDMMEAENREKLMIASYLGGMAAGNTGLVHPLSAGLSIVLHIPHGRANCYALSVLEEFYPEEHAFFRAVLKKQRIALPGGLCGGLDEDAMQMLYEGSIVHEKPLTNALGPDFKKILTRDKVLDLFRRM